jgi:hypothetical protein
VSSLGTLRENQHSESVCGGALHTQGSEPARCSSIAFLREGLAGALRVVSAVTVGPGWRTHTTSAARLCGGRRGWAPDKNPFAHRVSVVSCETLATYNLNPSSESIDE